MLSRRGSNTKSETRGHVRIRKHAALRGETKSEGKGHEDEFCSKNDRILRGQLDIYTKIHTGPHAGPAECIS